MFDKIIIRIKHVFSYINICQVLSEMLKTEGTARGFQHLRNLVNVNVLKKMFDHFNPFKPNGTSNQLDELVTVNVLKVRTL